MFHVEFNLKVSYLLAADEAFELSRAAADKLLDKGGKSLASFSLVLVPPLGTQNIITEDCSKHRIGRPGEDAVDEEVRVLSIVLPSVSDWKDGKG
jgi:hypothetical protein